MNTYRNTSDQDLAVVGVGVVKAGATVEIEGDFHNANFELVEKRKRDEKKETPPGDS